jgi:hypothetical protein
MPYTPTAKTSRMTKTRDDLNGGDIQFVGSAGQIIATVALSNPSGTMSGDIINFSGFPRTVAPAQTGVTIVGIKWRTSSGVDYRTDTEPGVVGLANSGARIIVSKLTPAVGDSITVQSVSLQHAA